MEAYVQSAIDVISQHSEWAGLVLFLVAFGESLVFLSLVVPGTTILIAAGALVPSGALDLPTVLIWGALGAIVGDAVSFWLGGHFRQSIPSWWLFRRHPEALQKGLDFFARHGGKSIFIGRFFGPFRAVVPLVAGMMGMPAGRFYVANVLSAILWVPVLVLPGALVGTTLGMLAARVDRVDLVVIIGVAAMLLGAWAVRRYRLADRWFR